MSKTTVYHASGLPIEVDDLEGLDAVRAAKLLAGCEALIKAGFLTEAPRLEEGENREPVSAIVRREHDGTPLLDVYVNGNQFRTVSVYLNTVEDQQAFEGLFGPLVRYPLYDGTSPIQRGQKPALDKYVTKTGGVADVIWRLNPKYEGESDKKHSKRTFVRWAAAAVTAEAEPQKDAGSVIFSLVVKRPGLTGKTMREVNQVAPEMVRWLASDEWKPEPGQEAIKAAAKTLVGGGA